MFKKILERIKSNIVIKPIQTEEQPRIAKRIRFTGLDSEPKVWSVKDSEIQSVNFEQIYQQCQI